MDNLNGLAITIKEITEATTDLQQQLSAMRKEPAPVLEVSTPVEFSQYLNETYNNSNGGILHKEVLDNGLISLKYNNVNYTLEISRELLTLIYVSMPYKFDASNVIETLSSLDNLTFKPSLRNSATIMRFFLAQFSKHCYSDTKNKEKLIVTKRT